MKTISMPSVAAAFALAFLSCGQLSLAAQEAPAVPENLNEAGELTQISKLNDSLDDEGRRLLNEFVQVLPKLDAKKLKAETAEKFPLSMLERLKAEFDAKCAPFKIGETVTVATRIKVYTGAFGGMKDGKMLVGNKLVPTIDLSQETMDRANPEIVAEKRRDFLKRSYYEPKAAYMLKAKEAIFADRIGKLDSFYKVLAQEHGKGRASQQDKGIDNVNVAVFVPVAPAPETAPAQQALPGQNAPSLASDSKENLN